MQNPKHLAYSEHLKLNDFAKKVKFSKVTFFRKKPHLWCLRERGRVLNTLLPFTQNFCITKEIKDDTNTKFEPPKKNRESRNIRFSGLKRICSIQEGSKAISSAHMGIFSNYLQSSTRNYILKEEVTTQTLIIFHNMLWFDLCFNFLAHAQQLTRLEDNFTSFLKT